MFSKFTKWNIEPLNQNLIKNKNKKMGGVLECQGSECQELECQGHECQFDLSARV